MFKPIPYYSQYEINKDSIVRRSDTKITIPATRDESNELVYNVTSDSGVRRWIYPKDVARLVFTENKPKKLTKSRPKFTTASKKETVIRDVNDVQVYIEGETLFFSTATEASEYLNISRKYLLTKLASDGETIYRGKRIGCPDNYRVRLAKNDPNRPWPVGNKLTKGASSIRRVMVETKSLLSGKVTVYDSEIDCAKACKVTRAAISLRLKSDGKKVFSVPLDKDSDYARSIDTAVDKCLFRIYVSDGEPWDDESVDWSWHNGTSRAKTVQLRSEKGIVYNYPSQAACGESLGISFQTISLRVATGGGRYYKTYIDGEEQNCQYRLAEEDPDREWCEVTIKKFSRLPVRVTNVDTGKSDIYPTTKLAAKQIGVCTVSLAARLYRPDNKLLVNGKYKVEYVSPVSS